MVSTAVTDAMKGQQMGTGMHQGTLFNEHGSQEWVGSKMHDSHTDAEREKEETGPNRSQSNHAHLGQVVCQSDASDKPEDNQATAHTVAKEMRDDSPQPHKSDYATQEKATASELMALIQLQQFRCSLTGTPITPEAARLDHIHPVSEGGGHGVGNLQWVTEAANKSKGTLGQDEFIQLCMSVADWHRRTR